MKYEIKTKLSDITYDPHTNTYNYKQTIIDSAVPLPISTPTHYTYSTVTKKNKKKKWYKLSSYSWTGS